MADENPQDPIQRIKTQASVYKRRVSIHESEVDESKPNVRESDIRRRQVCRCCYSSGHSIISVLVLHVKLIRL